MSIPTLAAPRVHLHWVRETPSRALALPVSETLTSIESLPPCAQTAVRATGLATVELHLPPYRPDPLLDFDAWLSGLQFRQDAAGRLVATCSADPNPLGAMAYHQAIVLTIRAVTEDTTPLTIVAESPSSAILPQQLPERHVCLPRGGFLPAPGERSKAYYSRYRALSLRIQAAVRSYMPPAHVDSLEQFEDRDHLLALFVWSAADPIVGRHVDALGVDVLDDDSVSRAFAGVPERLIRRFKDVSEILHRHNVRPLIRSSYSPVKADVTLQRCRTRRRYLHLLFSNEFRLIVALVRFLTLVPKWRVRGAANPAGVFRSIREEWEVLEQHFRHFYQRRPHSALGSHLLLEAVRALEAVD